MSILKLYDANGKRLLEVDDSGEIDRGGEGVILPHPQDKSLAIKLYHQGIVPALTPSTWHYLNRLNSMFIRPRDLFYTKSGTIAGFSMKLLDPGYFRLSRLFTKSQCLKMGITDTIKEGITRQLITAVEDAHHHQLVIGDLNPYNIFVNTNGEVQLIDVDSYQTPLNKHTGRLLDEIRDFYFLGEVSRESDMYALAVNIFRLFTYVHPYKGVHSIWKKLEDRAIKKISVLGKDPGLTVPSFYEPFENIGLNDQFIRLFEQGERFMIQFDKVNLVKKAPVRINLAPGDVSIKVLATDVLEAFFNQSRGTVKTTAETSFYACLYPGNPVKTDTIDNHSYDYLMVGHTNVLRVLDHKLFIVNNQILNLTISNNFRMLQMDHLVFGVDWDHLFLIRPDKIFQQQIDCRKIPAWGRGIKLEGSPIQNTGGINRLHFRNQDTINLVTFPVQPRHIITNDNIGVVTFIENEQVHQKWFRINGLTVELCKETEEIHSFAVKQNGETDILFVPGDGKIHLLRSVDFVEVDVIPVKICTAHSQVWLTHSGLMLLEDQTLYLINKK